MDTDRLLFGVGNLIDGKFFTEHYHAKPISPEKLHEFKEKELKGKLPRNEAFLVDEYFRAKHYEDRKQEIDRLGLDNHVVYLGSGFDGLPGHVFGQENMIMTSVAPKDFRPYRNEAKGTQMADKVISDFFNNPFGNGTFKTVVINGLQVFNPKSVDSYVRMRDDNSGQDQAIGTFWSEIRRISKPGAAVLVTDFDTGGVFPSSALISPEVRQSLEKSGWRVDKENYVEGSYCRLVAE